MNAREKQDIFHVIIAIVKSRTASKYVHRFSVYVVWFMTNTFNFDDASTPESLTELQHEMKMNNFFYGFGFERNVRDYLMT